MVGKQKTFRVQLVIIHHLLTRKTGKHRNLETAIRDLLTNNLDEKDTQDIKWETYIHSTTSNIFKEIILHSGMIDTLYYRQVFGAAVRRTTTNPKEESDSKFLVNIEQNKLKNLPYVTGELLDIVSQSLKNAVHDFALGRKEKNAEGKTGSTLEKIEAIIHEKVTNLNIRTASEYKKMLEKEIPKNQQRLQSSTVKHVVRSFPRKQLKDLADYMYRSSIIMEGNNQLSIYLYNIRREGIEDANSMLRGMSMGLFQIDNPHFDNAKSSVDRKERRWNKDFHPVVKTFYETELTNLSLSTLAEHILSYFYKDSTTPAADWKIKLIKLDTATGVYGTHYEPIVGDEGDSWGKVNLIFDGFRLAHEFVSVLRANNHLVKLNPYVFLYDNVALKFETYDDLIRNSNDYVKLRAKFHGELEKKAFLLPNQALAKLPEKLSSNFPEYIKNVLSWSADSYTTTWSLTGKEHTFSVTELVVRAGEGLHPSVVLFPRHESLKQDARYHGTKEAPITQPPYNFDEDVSMLWVDSSQLSYYEEQGLDWSDCYDENWDEEFVSATKEIVPNKYDYFAILLLLSRVYKQAIHHLNPMEGKRKTTMDIAFDLRNSSISAILWDLEQEDCASEVFFKLQDIVSDIPFSEAKVKQLLDTRGSELCGTLRVWVDKCAQSLVYVKNMVYDAKFLSRCIAEREMRPPIIDKKTIQDLRGSIYIGTDMRQFAISFPADVWYWDEDTTFGYLKRVDTDEYKTQIDKKTGVKYFLHHWGMWIGDGRMVKPWQSSARALDVYEDSSTLLLGNSNQKYIEGGG